jgi:hypothetical protein
MTVEAIKVVFDAAKNRSGRGSKTWKHLNESVTVIKFWGSELGLGKKLCVPSKTVSLRFIF